MHGRIVKHLVFDFVDLLDFAKYFVCVSDDNISASNRAKRFLIFYLILLLLRRR